MPSIVCATRYVIAPDRLGLATQATSRAAALLTLGRGEPRLTALVRRTHAAIDELGTTLGQLLPLHRNGSLSVATRPESRAALAALIAAPATQGVTFLPVTAGEARRLAPWLATPDDATHVLCPQDAFFDPYLLASAYAGAGEPSTVNAGRWRDSGGTPPPPIGREAAHEVGAACRYGSSKEKERASRRARVGAARYSAAMALVEAGVSAVSACIFL